MSLLYKISYGLYLVSSTHKESRSGCISNTLIQQTSSPLCVSITLNKANFTTELINKSNSISVAVLSQDSSFELIKNFGMQSGRDMDKFNGLNTLLTKNGNLVATDNSIGYFDLKVAKTIDMGTHNMYICDVTDTVELANGEALTYSYYQANIKPKANASQAKAYECLVCGYIHNTEIPEGFVCPICKHGKESFNKINNKKENLIMSKFVCMVCGHVHEGENAPDFCPVCKAPSTKFQKQDENMSWAAEHVVGIAKDVADDIKADLRANFNGECSEVGMYLAMSRVAYREGYPEVGLYYEKAAFEEAEHAAKFAELLGEVVTDSTKKNLQMRVEAENGATLGKTMLAKKAKEANLDAIHDTVHEMAKDEARHGKAFLGLLNRYFK